MDNNTVDDIFLPQGQMVLLQDIFHPRCMVMGGIIRVKVRLVLVLIWLQLRCGGNVCMECIFVNPRRKITLNLLVYVNLLNYSIQKMHEVHCS